MSSTYLSVLQKRSSSVWHSFHRRSAAQKRCNPMVVPSAATRSNASRTKLTSCHWGDHFPTGNHGLSTSMFALGHINAIYIYIYHHWRVWGIFEKTICVIIDGNIYGNKFIGMHNDTIENISLEYNGYT